MPGRSAEEAWRRVRVGINTHYHGDHTGGNPAFRGTVKSIVQQERCDKLHRDFTAKNNTAAQQAYADITFGESWSQTIGDEKVKVAALQGFDDYVSSGTVLTLANTLTAAYEELAGK